MKQNSGKYPQTEYFFRERGRGKIYQRKLVSAREITKWVRWGPAGKAMFQDAIELFNLKRANYYDRKGWRPRKRS